MTRVLVIDDMPDLRLMLRTAIEAAGWEVEEASSGEEALESFRRSPPSIVVVDYRMPGLSGSEVARTLRDEGFRGPLIVYSAYLTPEVEAEATALGATAISKTNFLELLRVIGDRRDDERDRGDLDRT